MAVFDKGLNPIQTEDESTKQIEEYIRYMTESVEFSMGNTAGRNEFTKLVNRVKALEDRVAALEAKDDSI